MDFNERVWQTMKGIPKGKVATYAILARAVNCPRAARAVGNACNKNPFSPKVPCHRVVCSNGSLGGFAPGPKAKEKLLEKEGIKVKNNKIVNFKEKIVSKKELVKNAEKARKTNPKI